MAEPMSAERSRLQPVPLVPLLDRDRLGAPLPVPLTSFVGREREVAEVGALLRGDARLVTLTGPGGVGKTRLALRVAETLRPDFPDGVCFVELAPIQGPDLVASAIAQALGVREAGDRPLAAQLAAWRDARLLLVLDNMEHLLAAAPLLADLLGACPRLSVLATSRAVLRLSGEHDVPVPPLSLSRGVEQATGTLWVREADAALLDFSPPRLLDSSEAVRLFVERTKAADPSFALTPETGPIVAAIVRQLDGLPLAIELAAARIRLLPPAALLARLTTRLPLLTGGPHDQPVRLRSMRDAVAWSYDLLDPDERALFHRLAIFVGGFTLDAVEAIAGAGGAPSVLDGVASLLDKSLLRRAMGSTPEQSPAPRYEMLETIREFGLECLSASGEEDATRRAHAAWCQALAEQEWERLVHEGWQSNRLVRLAADYDNLRAAAVWLEQTGDGEGLLRLVGCLGEFWMGRGHRREGRAWLERALDPARSAAAPAAVRARALHAAAWLAANRSDHDAALRQGSEALALWRELGDRQGMAQALSVLGLAALTRGDYDVVAAHAGEGEALAEELGEGWLQESGNHWLTAVATVQVGAAAFGRGDLARAAALLEEAIAQFGERGEPTGGAWWAANFLALVECARGDRAGAAARFAANLALWRSAGRREPLADTLAGVATLAAASGAPERAARLFGVAEALRDLLGYAVLLPERAAFERAERAARAALGGAAYDATRSAGRALPLEQAVAEAAAFLASIAEQPPVPPVAPADHGPAAGLTPREREVLRLVADGLTDREIAAALFVGPGTVRTHLTSVYGKLGVGSRTAAVAAARRLGLLRHQT